VKVPGAATIVDHQVARHGEEPRPRGRVALLEDRRPLPGTEQRLLHDVLREGRVVRQPGDIAQQGRCVRIVQRT
jgi:hypothetical protein